MVPLDQRSVRLSCCSAVLTEDVALQVLLIFVNQGFIGFYPTYLVEVRGLSPQVVSIVFSSYSALVIFSQSVTGICIGRFGAKLTVGILTGLYVLGLIAVGFARPPLQFLLVTVFLSQRPGTSVVNNTFLAEVLPDDIDDSGVGLLRTV
ncbi:hypothetical protein C2R22_24170 (plasmid) [Salinigranum rubrum]|uniref:Major facilitator superfamily (MFS) profile domain-containing protein n=1 Tax=Salinigranum rubrum TaxID=755307 RepID=A0A2I8VTW6_9EURY|nr:hypothetical protein C2R22_24170 [Salinigranum rubrum]